MSQAARGLRLRGNANRTYQLTGEALEQPEANNPPPAHAFHKLVIRTLAGRWTSPTERYRRSGNKP